MISFQQFAALAAQNVQINLQIQPAEAGKLEVNLFPVMLGASETPLIAKSFVATPNELDAGFTEILNQYLKGNADLASQLGDIQAAANELAKAAADTSTQTAKNKSQSPKRTVIPASSEVMDDHDDHDHVPDPGIQSGLPEVPQDASEQICFTL